MTTDTAEIEERRRELDALAEKPVSRMQEPPAPDLSSAGPGVQSAEYTKPQLDPQWMDAWKMFVDDEGEYGIPCKLPRGQWDTGNANALMHRRRPDGGRWFRLSTPERTQSEAQFGCFVGACRKRAHTPLKVVEHVRAFHAADAITHKATLERIEAAAAKANPRLQKLLGAVEEAEEAANAPPGMCGLCGDDAPDDHENPAEWVVRHTRSAHKPAAATGNALEFFKTRQATEAGGGEANGADGE